MNIKLIHHYQEVELESHISLLNIFIIMFNYVQYYLYHDNLYYVNLSEYNILIEIWKTDHDLSIIRLSTKTLNIMSKQYNIIKLILKIFLLEQTWNTSACLSFHQLLLSWITDNMQSSESHDRITKSLS